MGKKLERTGRWSEGTVTEVDIFDPDLRPDCIFWNVIPTDISL